MWTYFLVMLAAGLCASHSSLFAAELDDQKWQQHYQPAEGCLAARSFETTGDENSSFDPTIGCSTASNLAAMVASRQDLVRGRGTPYSDGERAGQIVSRYRAWRDHPAPPAAAQKPTETQ